MREGLAREAPDWRHAVAAVLFALIAGASGLLVAPPLDRDESRFVQATAQMLESGDYVVIRYQDLERNKKPVGIHWLQAGSVAALGGPEDRAVWKYRVPSLIGAGVTALGTYLLGCLLFGRRAAFCGTLVLAAAPVIVAEASIAKTDSALLACVVLAQLGLARAWTGARGSGTWLPFWLALAAGVLVKGPIAPMISGLTAGALCLATREVRWLGALRPLPGSLLLLALVLPWLVAIGVVTEGRFYTEAIGTDMLGKVGEAQESHSGPFGYHAMLLWALFWPASLFLPAALRWAVPKWRDPGVLFCLAWFLPSFIIFEAAGTKLPHYPMVTYPALALLVGALATTVPPARFRAWRWAGAALFAGIGLAASAAAVWLLAEHQDGGPGPISYALAAGVAILTVATTLTALRGRVQRAALMAAGTSAALGWVLFQHVLPRLGELAVTPRLEAALSAAGAHPRLDQAPPVALVGYHEPSAVFRLGTPTLLTSAEGAADWLRGGRGRIAVIEGRDRPAFLRAASGLAFKEVGVVEGLNYSNGDDVRLVLVRSK